MMVRNVSIRYKNTKSLTLPQFMPEIGDIFGQSSHYDIMAPGLDFAFGFYDDSYIHKAKERGWLLADETQTSPAMFSRTEEFDLEIGLEPIKGLKITLTTNRTDSRTDQIMFMYDNMNTTYSGSYTKTHCAILTALKGSSAENGYASATFDKFLENIPVIAQRLQSRYRGINYPTTGFMQGHALAGCIGGAVDVSRYTYSAWGSALSVLLHRAMREPLGVERARSTDPTFFRYAPKDK